MASPLQGLWKYFCILYIYIYTKYKVNRLNKYVNYSIKEKPKSLIRANQEKIKNRYNNYPDEVKTIQKKYLEQLLKKNQNK